MPSGVSRALLIMIDRLRLLVHILCELKDSHGVTTEKLREAGQDVRRQITPANRLAVLDEIYYVRQMEEKYLDGEIGMFHQHTRFQPSTDCIDANFLIQVKHTHLPEAVFQETHELQPRAHAAPVAVHKRENDLDAGDDPNLTPDEEDVKVHHSRSLPLSPTTSESSSTHSPSGGYNYGMTMAPSVHVIPPHESAIASKPMHADPGYLNGYYTQQFVPEKAPGAYWPHASSVSQYGY
jgi:hypothetical protein